MSDDDDDEQQKLKFSSNNVDNHRRLSEIKIQLQNLMRQKKKYDEDKLKQDAEFIQSEIQALRNAIVETNKEIKNQTQRKMKLQIEMTNLRSRSRIRWTNLTTALRDKQRYEAELRKPNKTEEYRSLTRREIQLIDTAIPTLTKEEEYKKQLTEAEGAQQTATNKRQRLEENLNKNLRKQTEVKQLLNENAEKLPEIETTIENLRCERERLLSLSSNHTKKSRRRLSSVQSKSLDSQAHPSIDEDNYDNENQQYTDQLNKVNILLQYFHEKSIEHGLEHQQPIPLTSSSELISPFSQPITFIDEQTQINNNQSNLIVDNNQSTTTIAIKLPRNFTPLDLNQTTTNDSIHSPFNDGNQFEYKRELSADIVDKYAGQSNKSKQQISNHPKKHKKNKKKNFAMTHKPQMISLYNQIRCSTNSSDALPSMPMYEYDLYSTIQSLQCLKQSVECYLIQLQNRSTKLSSIDDEQDEDRRDSVLDTVSETSSLIELIKECSNDETKIFDFNQTKNDYEYLLTPIDENQLNLTMKSICNIQIDRQISDEGYRSVQNDQQRTQNLSNQQSPQLIRSKSYDPTDKVDRWLINTTGKSLPQSITSNQDF